MQAIEVVLEDSNHVLIAGAFASGVQVPVIESPDVLETSRYIKAITNRQE